MATDTLAPCVARTSAAKALTMQDPQIVLFHKEVFQLPVSNQFQEM